MKVYHNRFIEKQTSLIGNITFLVLAIMAIVFWRERTIMLDASFQSFDVINKGKLAIQVQRFGAAFVQMFPLLTSKLGLPLKAILISYSLSFIIFHYLMFLICNYILKIKEMALSIVLFTILMTVHTFFWVQNEVIQGISVVFVYFALLINRERSQKIRWFDFPLALLILIAAVYFHPLNVFAFVFCILFFLISSDNIINLQKIIFSVASWIAIVVAKVYITKVSTYDVGSMQRFTTNISKPIAELKHGEAINLFLSHCFDDFVILILLALSIAIYYTTTKEYRKLVLFSLLTISYILLVLVSFYDSKFWFYLESQFLPLSVIFILPLVFDIIPSFKKERTALITISALIVYKLFYISYSSQIYTQRLNYLNELLIYTYRFDSTKFMVDNDDIQQNKLLMHWGCAYETLYLSLLKSPDSTRTIVIYDEPKNELWITGQKNSFHAAYDMIKYPEANHNYFNFKDTVHSYKLLSRKELPPLK